MRQLVADQFLTLLGGVVVHQGDHPAVRAALQFSHQHGAVASGDDDDHRLTGLQGLAARRCSIKIRQASLSPLRVIASRTRAAMETTGAF
jgi:hypothetical protein